MQPRASLLVLSLVILAGCAGKSPQVAQEVHDPAEPVNRVVFDGNQFVDRNLISPVARAYRDHLPRRVQTSVGNFVKNLGEPRVLVNDVLQGNVRRAGNTTGRFVVNTTVGVAGLFDVATDWGMPRHQADFGQTFGVWGIGPGPAVQLPLLGHSNARDTVGTVVGFVANPVGFMGDTIETVNLVGTGLGVVDGRAAVLHMTDDLQAKSLDYYAVLRSLTAQRRDALVADGVKGEVAPAAEGERKPPQP